MAYTPTRAEQKRVREWVMKWMPRLFLNGHAIQLEFNRKACKGNAATAAQCTTRTPYLDVTLRVFPIFWGESVADQERIILHELLHVVAQPSKDAACNLFNGSFVTWREIEAANETLVDTLTNVLWVND